MFLEVKNGVKAYGFSEEEILALDGVNFSLEKGRVCVIPSPAA